MGLTRRRLDKFAYLINTCRVLIFDQRAAVEFQKSSKFTGDEFGPLAQRSQGQTEPPISSALKARLCDHLAILGG